MDSDGSFRFILLAITLIFSAFFSGAEVALFSLDKKTIETINSKRGLIAKYISYLLGEPRRLLVTILLGNTIFNVAASIISVSLGITIAQSFGIDVNFMLMIQIVVLTILILIFGEVIPKVYASRNSVKFAKLIAFPLYWLNVFLYPITKTFTDVFRGFVDRFSKNRISSAITSSEITDLADLGVEQGTIEKDEHELIHGLFSFKSLNAREVMTPRVDMTAVPHSASLSELMEIITQSGHSRIPLYKENLDNVTGIIYAKDLLPFLGTKEEQQISLRKLCRPALFLPETKLINELLHEFQESNTHIGIVVDEYGGTSGVITLEDILEEIVGEIRDEYDKEELEITKIDENNFSVLGKTPIEDIMELLKIQLEDEEDDYDTIGGFIFNQAGTIPEIDYSFDFQGFNFKVIELENNRISKINIQRILEKE